MKYYIMVILYSVISSLLFILTLPPFNIDIAAWAAFIPLIILLLRGYRAYLVILGFLLTGLISNYFGYNWILLYQKSTFFIVWPSTAVIFPIFGFIVWLLLKRVKNIFLQSLLFPSIWIILLTIYSFTYIGYQWGEQFLAYSQDNIFLIQVTSLFGTMGLSFIILFFNSSLGLFIVKRNFKVLVPSLILVIMTILYGFYELNKKTEIWTSAKRLKIALVQPGLSGEPGFEDATPLMSDSQFLTCIKRRAELPQFVTLNRQAEREDPGLIIWSQYNLPVDLTKHSRVMNRFYTMFNKPILLGTFRYEGTKLANVSLLLDRHGEVAGIRTSVRGPPFRQMNQTFGRDYNLIHLTHTGYRKTFDIGAMLCYEDTDSEAMARMVDNGAEILLIHANNERFQETGLPFMHLRRDIFRAVESRRWLVRACTTGISAIIDPYGRIENKIDLGKKDIIYSRIPAGKNKTFFIRFKNFIKIFSLVYLIIVIGINLIKGKEGL